MDEKTLFKSKDITALIDHVRVKHQLHIKLGPAEQINQAIEEARENRQLKGLAEEDFRKWRENEHTHVHAHSIADNWEREVSHVHKDVMFPAPLLN